MRFNPQLIQPDDAPLDAQGEINLPDDLAELAAQLHADAAFLAERYPAALPTLPVATAAETATPIAPGAAQARWPLWAAAGLSTALIVIVSLASFSLEPIARNQARITPATPHIVPEERLTLDHRLAEPQESPLPGISETPDITPALLLHGVTGPELEGLLDLWENEGPQDTRISI